MEIFDKIKGNTILYAGYGYGDKTVDVTEKIKKYYKEGKKKIKADNTLGGDPYVGKGKFLFVVWTANGVAKSSIVAENTEITLPDGLLV